MGMTLWTELARAGTDAGDEIILRQRGDIYEIRFNGLELMSSFNHQSETTLAERSLRLHGRSARRILIGGLGLGFTLRTTLDWLHPNAEVVVCELVPEIVEWNLAHIGHLAGHPLRDKRVRVVVDDVLKVLEYPGEPYDIILMDTDNGPDFTVRETNGTLYGHRGLQAVRRALGPGGLASFWSATISNAFEERLGKLSWEWAREDIQLIGGRADAFHHIYFASTVLRPEDDPATAHSLIAAPA